MIRLGKTDHGGIHVDDSGRVIEMTVHQSLLNNFLRCPERCRNELLYPAPDSDAAGMGTSDHFAVSQQLNLVVQTGRGYTSSELEELAVGHWREVMRPKVQLSLNLTEDEYEAQVRQGVTNWWKSCWLGEGGEMELWAEARRRELWTGLEWHMRWPDYMEVEGIRVHLGGTCDVAQPSRLLDWKFSRRPRKQWEAQRWDIQATTYMALARYLGYCPDPPVMWIVVVPVERSNDAQVVRVERGPEWDDWLRWQVLSFARFVARHGIHEPWPTNDQHSLCSPRWCSAWTRCKGAFGIQYPPTQAELKEMT